MVAKWGSEDQVEIQSAERKDKDKRVGGGREDTVPYGSDGGESIIKSGLQTLARYGHDTLTDTGIGLVVLV